MAKRVVKSPTKALRIECTGADRIPWKDLTPLQGDLKVMDPEDKMALRTSLVGNGDDLPGFGFSFAFDAWRDPKTKKIYIMDGHQRMTVIAELAAEGWAIPDLPVCWTHAKNKEEAMQKLLAAASQYGRVTVGGLTKFIKISNTPVSVLPTLYRFPEIDMVKFQQGIGAPASTKEVSFTARDKGELDQGDFKDFEHTCPKCGFEFNG